jgi:hypothetical protein
MGDGQAKVQQRERGRTAEGLTSQWESGGDGTAQFLVGGRSEVGGVST